MRSDKFFPLFRQESSPKALPLIDRFGRKISYLRLAVTDRCNLRCRYCMPSEGNPFYSPDELLSFAEMERLISLFVSMGITKVRLTGGEPFARPGLMDFLGKITQTKGLDGVYITTNGVLAAPHIKDLKNMGIAGINLSLDTLQKKRYATIARKDAYDDVIETLFNILRYRIPLKLNFVIQAGVNTDEIVDMAKFAKSYPVQVRFIEQMPFNGAEKFSEKSFGAKNIKNVLLQAFPQLTESAPANTTATLYKVPEFKGEIGIIAGYSRSFCKTCNRIRITANGALKTCLYGRNVLNLHQMLRQDAPDAAIQASTRACITQKHKDGHTAEQRSEGTSLQSMAAIGG